MNPLQTFYNNEAERKAVHDFMIDSLKELAVEKAFDGKSTLGIQEGKECIGKMFIRLEESFGKKKEPIINSSR